MTRLNEFVDRYVALWNEPDPELRRKAVTELWTEDGTYVNDPNDLQGHEAIDAQITFAHDEYVGKGFTFKSSHNAIGHHNLVKFNWVMVAADTGELASIGFDFVILSEDGRIVADYQFIERAPVL